MNKTSVNESKKPLFSGIAAGSLLLAVIIFYFASGRLSQEEIVPGYGDLGILASFAIALLLSGVIFGQIALFRGEKPVIFPALVLMLNIAGIVFLLISLGTTS